MTRTAFLLRALALTLLLGSVSLAGNQWVIFKGQVNGPVTRSGGADLNAFRLKNFPGLFWSEGYYHHLNFPDGSMITVSLGFNRQETNLLFVYGKPGQKPFRDYLITDLEKAKFEPEGFALSVGPNRAWLAGDKYYLELAFGQVKTKIEYTILSPSYTYGDGFLRYPDGKSYAYYSLPIPWAKVKVQAVLAGKEYKLEGFGNMNHDAAVLFPPYYPSNWQVFWFFGPDHALAVTDFFTHPEFGRTLVQRLVFSEKGGQLFTSTSFVLKWEDWVRVEGIPFRYPRHYLLRAEAGGARLEGEVRLQKILLREDLYSNLPSYLKAIIERLTKNGWTVDAWADYTINYTRNGKTNTYKGQGIVRWMDLEEEK